MLDDRDLNVQVCDQIATQQKHDSLDHLAPSQPGRPCHDASADAFHRHLDLLQVCSIESTTLFGGGKGWGGAGTTNQQASKKIGIMNPNECHGNETSGNETYGRLERVAAWVPYTDPGKA